MRRGDDITSIKTDDEIDFSPDSRIKRLKEQETARLAADVSFARPPFASELMTKERKKKFDALPGFLRHFVKRLIDHGDVIRAKSEAGLSKQLDDVNYHEISKENLENAMNRVGLVPQEVALHLRDCMQGETTKLDKNGKKLTTIDYTLKLKAIEQWGKMMGLTGVGGPKTTARGQRSVPIDVLFEETSTEDEEETPTDADR